jgi:hypothetical protein
MEIDPRITALAALLGCDAEEIEEAPYGENAYRYGSWEYLVLTDEEADKATAQDIEQGLWAFNASFLVSFLPDGVGEEVIEALQPQGEGANDAIRSMVGDRFEDLVSEAISADGRGHFLAGYDGNEDEEKIGETYFYIYRTN